MKKLLVWTLCFCMLLGSTAFAEMLGEYPVTTQPVTFTAWAIQPNSSMVDNFNENPAYQELERITGVHIEWENVSSEGSAEKRALRLAQGNLPDLFFRCAMSDNEVTSLASAGQLVDLGNLLNENAPNFMALVEKDPSILASIMDADGHVYTLPQITTPSITSHLILNVKWLENLGLKMPTTRDEYYEVLKAFKEQDANGNGNPDDEIPLSAVGLGGFTDLMHSFGVYIDNYYGMFVYPGNTNVECSYIADGMKEALTWLKKLYDEGLIDPESFSQSGDTYTVKGTSNTLGSLRVAGAFVNVGNDLHFDYRGLAPFPDQNGNCLINKRHAAGGNQFCITSNCSDPAMALRWVDYLYSEAGTTLVWLGVEGVSWEWKDAEKTTWRWIKPDDMTMQQFRHSYAIQGGTGYPAAHPIWFESSMWDRQEDPIEASLDTDLFRKPNTDCGVVLWPPIKWTLEQSEELGFILPDCSTYFTSSAVDFITGVRDIDAEWDSYVNTMKDMGIEKAIAICQDAYDTYQAKLTK